MSLFKPRKKTTRSPRVARRNGDLQQLHIKVSSPRIVMIQVMRGLGASAKVIMILAMLGLVVWGGWRGVQHLFLGNEKYKLQEIDLQTNGHFNVQRLMSITSIDPESSIFAIDTAEISERLRELPEVIDCEVAYRLPGTLKVDITERVPAVWIECEELGLPGRQNGGVLADKDGITFPCEGYLWESSRDLPVIVVAHAAENAFVHGRKMNHPEVMRALRLIQEFDSAKVRAQWQAERVVLVNDYSMEAVCNDGTRAIFGMYDHSRQIADFITICEHSLKTQRSIQHVNLIPQKNIPVKFAGDPVLIKPRRKPVTVSPDVQEIESILDRD
ncbi:FtsQ-type POTRA domain-containing protein [Verrucomicrobiaceae bacterium R5-34]|uniref:FtsQ-type POTRA domain-containing protein n=1 Tax=Oceaniferula flava TaxID=2800421 RepID=A0AAE2SBQ8_9BACT|nr:FtsQ-type POTRA domain-containing protein [Oceaniferula flavus]MBK1831660.1 FtsQ-type POTRA domain-containing protein [Verrucomicrobiaceae bacterium R5-34]MBK1854004.1 FtsQ-type POTRA domain-containing protein [Oceaniferula flavus]MBM1135310.1 FtsQ-type POTRA domain-containing protein [Oceaniferula flavus]